MLTFICFFKTHIAQSWFQFTASVYIAKTPTLCPSYETMEKIFLSSVAPLKPHAGPSGKQTCSWWNLTTTHVYLSEGLSGLVC